MKVRDLQRHAEDFIRHRTTPDRWLLELHQGISDLRENKFALMQLAQAIAFMAVDSKDWQGDGQ